VRPIKNNTIGTKLGRNITKETHTPIWAYTLLAWRCPTYTVPSHVLPTGVAGPI